MSNATFYRRRKPTNGPQQPIRMNAHALDHGERRKALETLSSKRLVDRSPGEIVATLLDQGVYLCSERIMYRLAGPQDYQGACLGEGLLPDMFALYSDFGTPIASKCTAQLLANLDFTHSPSQSNS